jgi:hypothetical protein
MNSRWIVMAFLLASALLWLPFDDYTIVYQTRPGGEIPAGEVRAGFMLAQTVRPPGDAETATGARQPCFAIRFATYARHNRGVLRVDWRQGERRQSWQVAVKRLSDNSYRHFCPDAGFDPDDPFRVEIHGIDGKPGHSATFWLVGDTRFGHAEIPPGQGPQDASIALQGSAIQHVGPVGMLRIDHGAWVFGWLCTMVIGIVAIRVGLADANDRSSG